ncbi:hypothetical protein BGZ76_004206 [Entomortierella beljakovae]|nr:hypothetical protein BGZ76_004206 [Entomortierella beljakovae]
MLVTFVPEQLSTLLDVDTSEILVLAIRDSSTNSNNRAGKKRDLVTSDNEGDAILLTVSIPIRTYWSLNKLVVNKTSSLYVTNSNSFGQYVDPTFPLSKNPPAQSNGGLSNPSTPDQLVGDYFGSDPSTVVPKNSNKNSNGALIGSVVGVATIAYIAIAVVVIRNNRRKKRRKEEEELAYQQNLSMSVRDGAQGWGWHRS